jgi:glycosyltransferase involved in cell wall biosynthesis
MKVAILTNGYGLLKRGAEQFTEELYDNLKGTDVELDIYGCKDTDKSIGMNQRNRFQIKAPSRHLKAILESRNFCKKWIKYMNSNNLHYDVIINNSGFPGTYYLRKHRKTTGTPFITRCRGGGREALISKWLKPDCMVFLSEVHKNRISFTGRSEVISNGIDLAVYKKIKKKEINFKKPIILCVGAMAKVKRHELLIDAVAKLDWGTLVLIGASTDKRYENYIKNYGNKSLGERFQFIGEVPHEEVLSYYKAADIFALASEAESFGIVFLEAMASGLPVVTQKDKKRLEIIDDAGVLINCEDAKAFANGLEMANSIDWKDKPLKRAQEYDWNTIKNKYRDLLWKIKT